jgi:hypothetical protein
VISVASAKEITTVEWPTKVSDGCVIRSQIRRGAASVPSPPCNSV